MKYLFSIILFIYGFYLSGQSRTDLEEQRKKTLDEISYMDNLLRNTEKEKRENINSLRILGNKLGLREKVIRGMSEEINLLNNRLEINNLAIEMMQEDLIRLKKDYSGALISLYKTKKTTPDIVYILSARDFNQGYKRMKYLQQMTKFRRNEYETIGELILQIEETKEKLTRDLLKIKDLRTEEEQQRFLLQDERNKNQRIINNLGRQEKQLQKELEEKKKLAKKIENAIARLIEEEKKKSLKTELTPEQILISDDFSENKGRLPWPVDKGVITSHFGTHQHPVLKYLTEENIGIEITCDGRTSARSIFKGQVTAISAIAGANMTVIIRHGKYLSVYNNLVNVKVKTGDIVETKQEIGEIFYDLKVTNNSVLKFMIFEQKYLDPEQWITNI